MYLQGHNKPITVLTLSPDRKTIYTGSHDGYITHWDSETGVQIQAMVLSYNLNEGKKKDVALT